MGHFLKNKKIFKDYIDRLTSLSFDETGEFFADEETFDNTLANSYQHSASNVKADKFK